MRRVRLTDAQPVFDDEDIDGFRAAMARFGRDLGAERTGVSLYELPPGEAVCPYHYEYGEEEWLLVLDGVATVRTPEGDVQAGPQELFFFPTGPEGAHQVRNDGDALARVLMFSNVVSPTATCYPDSDKVGVYTGDKAEDRIFVRSDAVDYFHGEGGAGG